MPTFQFSSWSIGYFTKVPLRKDLERLPEVPPEPIKKTATEMEMRPGDKAPNPGKFLCDISSSLFFSYS